MGNRFSKIRCLVCNTSRSPRQWLERKAEGDPIMYMKSGGRGRIETVGFDKSPKAFPLVREAVKNRVLVALRNWIKWGWINIEDDLFPFLEDYGYKVSRFSSLDKYVEEEEHPSFIRFPDAGSIEYKEEKFEW